MQIWGGLSVLDRIASVVQVMQRDLPRPDVLTALQEPPSLDSLKDSPLESAEALLQAELIGLLQHEAAKYPVKKRGKRKRGEPDESVPLGPLGPWEDFLVSPQFPLGGLPGNSLSEYEGRKVASDAEILLGILKSVSPSIRSFCNVNPR